MDPQGRIDFAASNYFTNSDDSKRGTKFFNLIVQHKYFVENGVSIGDRRVPRFPETDLYSGTDASASDGENAVLNCGINNTFPFTSSLPHINCEIPNDMIKLEVYINSKEIFIESLKSSLNNQVPFSPANYKIKIELNSQINCLERATNNFIDKMIATKDDNYLISFYSQRSFEARAKAFGALMKINKFSKAKQFLDLFDDLNENEQNFKIIQDISLRSPLTFEIEVTENELIEIKNIGEKFHLSSSSYARALYFRLTEELIPHESAVNSNFSLEDIDLSARDNEIFTIAPNPNHGEFDLYSNYDDFVSVEVFNVSGQSILKTELNPFENRGLNIERLNKGLFLLIIREQSTNKHLETLKIFIQ